MVSVSEWALSEKVVARLAQRAAVGDLPQITVLPSQRRDGIDVYSEADLEALKVRASPGLTVDYLDGVDERRFLAEYSAGVALLIAIGVAANIGSASLIGLANYVVQRVRAARASGTLANDAAVEVRIAKIERTRDDVRIEGLQVSANSDEVAKALLETLAGMEASRELLREVDDI